ncbi:MAG: hypothetical protein AUJ96_08985 [Armatimonadetes bacterium CG2_30_66_41]|nr:DUF86 domain-containing protein [Armatimonadota bacterium]OIP06476.1 MAG: hypothetical protein AUJ96_08985 [Armatimonadetes bacterium CG2_30_66_41]
MTADKGNAACLWDMLDAARAVEEFIAGRTFLDYTTDRMLRGAVERHLEIIGEAANNVSREFRDRHPELPWSKIIAQRHVLAHEYGEVKHERIWSVATVHLPQLIAWLTPRVPPAPGPPPTEAGGGNEGA